MACMRVLSAQRLSCTAYDQLCECVFASMRTPPHFNDFSINGDPVETIGSVAWWRHSDGLSVSLSGSWSADFEAAGSVPCTQ
jgi:hypothetical protein